MKHLFTHTLLKKELWFIYILLGLACLLALFKIHGSSVGMYHSFFNGGTKDTHLLWQQPRPIRSDEWLLATPLYISQVRSQLPEVNQNKGLGENVSAMTEVPAKHWKTLFHPTSWLFFILPLEEAFAFKWWLRGMLLAISTYIFFMYVTHKNYFISISLSLVMFFTPFNQWWYSVTGLESITYAFFILIFFMRIIHYKKKLALIIDTLALAYVSLCFIFVLYPPFLIPLGWLIVFFCLGYLKDNSHLITKKRIMVYISVLLCLGIIVASIVTAYFVSFRDIISTIQNTVYPGKRVVLPTSYSPLMFFGSFYNIFLQKHTIIVPNILANQSEASSFFMIFPFLLPFILYRSFHMWLHKKQIPIVLFSISVYLVIMSMWLFGLLPHAIGKMFLLHLVPQNRLLIGIGTANIMLLGYWIVISQQIKLNMKIIIASVFMAVSAALIVGNVGIELQGLSSEFISQKTYIYIVSGAVATITLLFLLKRNNVALILLVCFCVVSTYKVNPLYRGLDPLINTSFAQKIADIQSRNADGSRWVAYDNIILGNYLLANGAKTLTGTYFYPQLTLWKQFDPEGLYQSVYNRYAHVVFTQAPTTDTVNIVLSQADSFVVQISPCHQTLVDLQVNYFVFNYPVQADCLKEEVVLNKTGPSKDVGTPIYIYTRKK